MQASICAEPILWARQWECKLCYNNHTLAFVDLLKHRCLNFSHRSLHKHLTRWVINKQHLERMWDMKMIAISNKTVFQKLSKFDILRLTEHSWLNCEYLTLNLWILEVKSFYSEYIHGCLLLQIVLDLKVALTSFTVW